MAIEVERFVMFIKPRVFWPGYQVSQSAGQAVFSISWTLKDSCICQQALRSWAKAQESGKAWK
ncbi:unnamed protein product [Fusarium graminearum]|nr:unnamed protein product [Fusarium graminearum]CAG1959172.1 unnamed protein product [Fusarium graminearum]VTO91592.1 unnamed protein product [Fusarium graminearum]